MSENGLSSDGEIVRLLEESNKLNGKVRHIVLVLTVTTILAVGAMILSVLGLVQRTNDIQTERYNAAQQSCELLRTLYKEGGAATASYLEMPPLNDCSAYAKTVVETPTT